MIRRNEKPRANSSRLSADVSSVLALVAKEDAVILGPAFLGRKARDAAVVPVTDTGATRNLFLLWQRRQTTAALRTLLDALPFQTQSSE